MSVMILLIAFSLSVAAAFLVAFIISTKRGQYDDVHSPSMRMLLDEEPQENSSSKL